MQRSTTTTPDEFLDSLPDGTRDELRTIDAALAPIFAADERVVWVGRFWGGTDQRIVGYGLYRYKGRSGAEGEWFIAGLAAQKDYLSIYVNAAEDGESVMKRDGAGLGKVAKLGSGVASFKRLADIDLPAVVALATRARDLAPK